MKARHRKKEKRKKKNNLSQSAQGHWQRKELVHLESGVAEVDGAPNEGALNGLQLGVVSARADGVM